MASNNSAFPFVSFHTEAIQHQPLLRAEHRRLGASSFIFKTSQPSGDHHWERKEGKSLGWLCCLMLQVTHFAFLKKIVLTAGLPDLFHHRLNPKPGISWNFSTNYCCGVCKALCPFLTILLLHSKELLGQQQVSRFFFCCMFAPDQNNILIIVTLVFSQRHAVLFTAVLCVWTQPPLTFRCVSATETNSL